MAPQNKYAALVKARKVLALKRAAAKVHNGSDPASQHIRNAISALEQKRLHIDDTISSLQNSLSILES